MSGVYGKTLKEERYLIGYEKRKCQLFTDVETSRTDSVWFDFLQLVAATKFCCGDKNFHKNSPVHTKRFVAATCRLTLLLQLVARPVHMEWSVAATCCSKLSPSVYRPLVVSASQDAGGYEISRQNNLKFPYPYVDWDILHWYACSADGRSVGRSVGQTLKFLPRSKRTNAHSLNLAIVQILNQRSRYCGKPSNFPHLLNFKPFYRFIKSFSIFVPFFHFPHGTHQCTILLANFRSWWRNRLISQLRVWSEGTQVSRFKSWVRLGTPRYAKTNNGSLYTRA